MTSILPDFTISPFVAEWVPRLSAELGPGARALDLAMGAGRHAVLLAEAGFATFGVDVSISRLLTAQRRASERGLRLHQWAADLVSYPLPLTSFDLLLCTRFLLRARWADLRGLVRPGGFVLYETFTNGQVRRGEGPISPDHLLLPTELGRAFADWHVLAYEETDQPGALARLAARKPGGRV